MPYPRPTTRGARPDPEEEAAFERVKEVRNGAAGRLGLERGRVMANQALREVVAAMPGNRAELEAVAEVRAVAGGHHGQRAARSAVEASGGG